MFKDVKTNMLFTMNLLNLDEQDDWIRQKMNEKGFNALSPHEEA